jgi:hypothetical protein
MSETEPQPAAMPPNHPPFQFRLRTLLLLFVVLGSSLAVFGAWGIAVFGVIVGLAIYIARAKTLKLNRLQVVVLLAFTTIAIDAVGFFFWQLLPAISAARQRGWQSYWPNIAALAVWLLSVGTLLVGAVRRRKPNAVNQPPDVIAHPLGDRMNRSSLQALPIRW